MTDAESCHKAILTLGGMLDGVDEEFREKHIPARTVGCVISDLDIAFVGRVDPTGLHDLKEAHVSAVRECEVRACCKSDDLLALASGDDSFLSAWLHGRVGVSASMRDILRLRSLIGL